MCQDRGACTSVRLTLPAKKIADLGLCDMRIVGAGDPDAAKKIDDADIIWLGRAASDSSLNYVVQAQHLGKRVVYDLDDDMFNISPMSPHYKQLGIMPVDMERPSGEKIPMWRDGENGFDVAKSRQIRRDFIKIIRQVDVVTCTTPPLGAQYGRFNDRVAVIPNAIDFRTWAQLPVRWREDQVRILYTGAANHQEDWMFIRPALEEIQRKYPQVVIVSVGMDWRYLQHNFDLSRFEVHGWVDFDAYPYMMKGLCGDIGLAPISKVQFNDCRSSLKWVEYSALKIPTIATDYGPYLRDVRHGETGLLVDSQKDWFDALESLVTDATKRKELGENAHRTCKRDFNLDFTVDKWMDTFREVM